MTRCFWDFLRVRLGGKTLLCTNCTILLFAVHTVLSQPQSWICRTQHMSLSTTILSQSHVHRRKSRCGNTQRNIQPQTRLKTTSCLYICIENQCAREIAEREELNVFYFDVMLWYSPSWCVVCPIEGSLHCPEHDH